MKPQDSTNIGNNADNSSLLSPIFNLFGIIGASIPAHLIITPAINVGGKRVKENADYISALKESVARPVGIQLQDTARIMQRRVFASMLPAVVSKQIAQQCDWPLSALMPLNAVFETVIGSKLEPKEKFSSVNSAKYPLIYPLQPGQLISSPANILQVTREEFFALTPNNPTTKNYGEKEWQDLSQRQIIFKQNYPERAAALFCRNLSFCGASVVAGPLATKFVMQNRDQIEKAGIDIKHADYAATLLCRMFFAWTTTPFDSLATKLSAGDLTAKEVMLETMQNIKARNVSSFFAGAAARTILATTTSTTVAFGSKGGKYIESFIDNLAETIEQHPFYKMLSFQDNAMSKNTLAQASKHSEKLVEEITQGVTKVVPGSKIIESVTNLSNSAEIKKAVENSEQSIAKFGHQIALDKPAASVQEAEQSTLKKQNSQNLRVSK